MDHPASHDELLELAYQLAHFIHNDKQVALRIATAALEKLDTADSRQDKRRYYNPSGQRRKVSMPDLLLLQRLVYAESESHEKLKEALTESALDQAALKQATMVKHFIKHLIKITGRRNSLHVTLGIGRLLHEYSTLETGELYRLVSQDPDRVPEDAYWRARKGILMSELKERFGQLLAVERGPRGQDRFRAQQDSRRFARLVRECLEQFMPWQTRCSVPERFDPFADELNALAFLGDSPDEMHQIEINRYHAVLHPLCFQRLVLALGYATPESRLNLPQFILSSRAHDDNDDDDDDSGNVPPPKLNDHDRDSVHRHLSRQAGRRQTSTAGLLLFVVDGEKRARLNPGQPDKVSFSIARNAEFIEVHTIDAEGELLLAVHSLELDQNGDLAEQQTEIELADGRSFRLSVMPTHDAGGEMAGASVNAVSLATAPAVANSGWMFGRWLKPALTYALLLIAAGLLFNRLARKDDSNDVAFNTSSPTPVVDVRPSSSPAVQSTPTPIPSVQATPTPVRRISPPLVTPSPMTRDDVSVIELPVIVLSEEGEKTRAELEIKGVASLLAVKRLYIDEKGSVKLAKLFGEKLKQQLQSSGEFSFADSPLTGTADGGAVKLTLTPVGRQVRVIVSIVNAGGKILWPLKPGIRALQYTGSEEKVLDKLSRDLISDIQKLKQKK